MPHDPRAAEAGLKLLSAVEKGEAAQTEFLAALKEAREAMAAVHGDPVEHLPDNIAELCFREARELAVKLAGHGRD